MTTDRHPLFLVAGPREPGIQGQPATLARADAWALAAAPAFLRLPA